MQLRVRAVPNAKKSEVIGWEQDPQAGRVLRVKIAAPPVEGKANEAIRLFLASYLKLPRSTVRLLKGDTSRYKTFELPDGTVINAPEL